MNWLDWLEKVGHLSLPEIRCEIPPTQEVLDMIDATGLGLWESYVAQLKRRIVRDHWVWPERSMLSE